MKKEIIKKGYIYKWDNIVDNIHLDRINDYYQMFQDNEINEDGILPWFEDNVIYWHACKGTQIHDDVKICRERLTEAVRNSYDNELLVPNTTTIVRWKEGKEMAAHKDNGYADDKETFEMREYTAVLYVNDDYEGGETFVLEEGSDKEVISYKPKKNSMLVFRSDESCIHGVKKILKGNRLTLSIWFTSDRKFIEL